MNHHCPVQFAPGCIGALLVLVPALALVLL